MDYDGIELYADCARTATVPLSCFINALEWEWNWTMITVDTLAASWAESTLQIRRFRVETARTSRLNLFFRSYRDRLTVD